MSHALVSDLRRGAITIAVLVAAPMMIVAMLVGLLVSVLQAVTQIQEQTLTFIPKIVGLCVVMVVAGPWMLGQLLGWTEDLYSRIPTLVGG